MAVLFFVLYFMQRKPKAVISAVFGQEKAVPLFSDTAFSCCFLIFFNSLFNDTDL